MSKREKDFEELESSFSELASETKQLENQSKGPMELSKDLFGEDKIEESLESEEEHIWTDSEESVSEIKSLDWLKKKQKVELKFKNRKQIKKESKIFESNEIIQNIEVDKNLNKKVVIQSKNVFYLDESIKLPVKVSDFVLLENEIIFVSSLNGIIYSLKNKKLEKICKKTTEKKFFKIKKFKIGDSEFLGILGENLNIFEPNNLNLKFTVKISKIIDFCQLSNNSILILTVDGKVCRIKFEGKEFKTNLVIDSVFGAKEIFFNKYIFIGTENGLEIFDGKDLIKSKIFKKNLSNKKIVKFNFGSSYDLIFFCFKGALKVFDITKNTFFDTVKEIRADNISVSGKELYLSFNKGVWKYNIL